jgi:hypothetical protein
VTLTPIQFIQAHTYTSIAIALTVSNAVAFLPTPGPNSSGLYKWFFGFSHATFGMIPRVIVTFFPAVAQFLNMSTLQTPESRVAARAATAEAEMAKTPNVVAVTTVEKTVATIAKDPVK